MSGDSVDSEWIEERVYLYALMAEIELTMCQERGYRNLLSEVWRDLGMSEVERDEIETLLFAECRTHH